MWCSWRPSHAEDRPQRGGVAPVPAVVWLLHPSELSARRSTAPRAEGIDARTGCVLPLP